jgi:hypothetical protein
MDRRKLGIAFAFGAIVLLLVGAFTKKWWVEGGMSSGFLGAEFCGRSGHCESISWLEAKDTFALFLGYGGYAALVGTLVLVALLGYLGYASAARPELPPRTGAKVTFIVAILALLGGIGYAFGWNFAGAKKLTIGYSAYIYFAGAVVAIAAARMLRHSGATSQPPIA